jgi:hypothetical protein
MEKDDDVAGSLDQVQLDELVQHLQTEEAASRASTLESVESLHLWVTNHPALRQMVIVESIEIGPAILRFAGPWAEAGRMRLWVWAANRVTDVRMRTKSPRPIIKSPIQRPWGRSYRDQREFAKAPPDRYYGCRASGSLPSSISSAEPG